MGNTYKNVDFAKMVAVSLKTVPVVSVIDCTPNQGGKDLWSLTVAILNGGYPDMVCVCIGKAKSYNWATFKKNQKKDTGFEAASPRLK